MDDNLAGDLNNFKKIISFLKKNQITWGCQIALRSIKNDTNTIHGMAESGCGSVYIGIETGSPEMLKIIKGISKTETLEIIDKFQSTNINFCAGFILGHPWDNTDSIKQTISMAKLLRKEGILVLIT